MVSWEPQNPDFEACVSEGLASQKLMGLIGARLRKVLPGEVEIELPFREDLTQNDGFFHAAMITAIVDNACGFAVYSLLPADVAVVSSEYKVNFLAPGKGERLIARGRVLKPGRRINVCAGDVFAVADGQETLVATMLATMVAVPKRSSLTE